MVRMGSCFSLAKAMSAGRRIMVPSSCMSSHSTPAGASPASCMRSTVPSVWPLRWSTPPASARSGNTWPGRARLSGWQSGWMAVLMVVTRSAADTPVVTPSFASMDTVKPVWLVQVLCSTIMGRPSCLTCFSGRQRHTMPLHSLIINAICSAVMDSAA